MKPTNKHQRYILELSQSLKDITQEQKDWGRQKVLEHIAYKQKSGKTFCLDCGDMWIDKSDLSVCHCPNCNQKLKVEITTKKKNEQLAYYHIVDVVQGVQLIRVIQLRAFYEVTKEAVIYEDEVVRQFITENGKHEFVGKMLTSFCNYQNAINWGGELEIRNNQSFNKFNVYPDKIYPKIKVLPKVKRNGFKASFYDLTPLNFILGVLSNNRAETLLKSNQKPLFRKLCVGYDYGINKYWNTIKICLRHNYIITDVSMYFDYLDLISRFKKDLKNPKYVCPTDLKAEHDKWVHKVNVIREREIAERRRLDVTEQEEKLKRMLAEMEILNEEYKESKEKFFKFNIVTSSGLNITVLNSVDEFKYESDTLNHCVFTNEYFKKENSLILSARLNGLPIETIEIDLSSMSIQQVRGNNNRATEYNEEIRQALESNIYKLYQYKQTA